MTGWLGALPHLGAAHLVPAARASGKLRPQANGSAVAGEADSHWSDGRGDVCLLADPRRGGAECSMAPACGRRSALAERRERKWRRWRPGRRRRAATARARTPSVRAGASPRASTPKWRCWPSTCSSRCPRTGRSRPGPSWRRWPTYRPSSVSPARRQPFPPAQISLLLLSPQTNPITPSHPSPPTIPYYCTTDMLHQPPAPRNAFILDFIFSSLSDWFSILPHP